MLVFLNTFVFTRFFLTRFDSFLISVLVFSGYDGDLGIANLGNEENRKELTKEGFLEVALDAQVTGEAIIKMNE